MAAGAPQVAGAAEKLAESGVIEVIVPECGIAASFLQGVDARPRTVNLGHHDRTV